MSKRDRDKRTKGSWSDPEAGGSGAGFADLLRAHGLVSDDPEPSLPDHTGPPSTVSSDAWLRRKLVVRRERKGRGGKTVTRLEGAAGEDLEALARTLRKALGCGARVEEDVVVLQGDIGERVADWLSQRGARRVVRGS